MKRFDVAVVGSLHYDIVVHAPRLPGRDETVIGTGRHFVCGGKGGNQAVAAARAGASACMTGAVGDDDPGRVLVANLRAAGVEVDGVNVAPGEASGMSVAILEPTGDYGAIIVSGANLTLGERDFTGVSARVLLLQNEIPAIANRAAAKAGRANGALVIFNAAPHRAGTELLAHTTDLLVVNRVEASQMTGMTLSGPADAAAAAWALAADWREVVVTLGGDGLVHCVRGGAPVHREAVKTNVVSTHGAGDAFCGALAAALAKGVAMDAALAAAQSVAARKVAGG